MAKGTLTLRDKELKALSAAEWAARFGAKPLESLLCDDTGCHTGLTHVHARRGGRGFRVDPRTGRWLTPAREAGL